MSGWYSSNIFNKELCPKWFISDIESIITDLNEYNKYKYLFKKNKINFYFGLNNLNKVIKKKISYTINGISGIDGLEPTLKIIPLTRNILIANKESIVCGWHLIKKKLNSHKTKFIPIDSEHFSLMKLLEILIHLANILFSLE